MTARGSVTFATLLQCLRRVNPLAHRLNLAAGRLKRVFDRRGNGQKQTVRGLRGVWQALALVRQGVMRVRVGQRAVSRATPRGKTRRGRVGQSTGAGQWGMHAT